MNVDIIIRDVPFEKQIKTNPGKSDPGGGKKRPPVIWADLPGFIACLQHLYSEDSLSVSFPAYMMLHELFSSWDLCVWLHEYDIIFTSLHCTLTRKQATRKIMQCLRNRALGLGPGCTGPRAGSTHGWNRVSGATRTLTKGSIPILSWVHLAHLRTFLCDPLQTS